MPLSQPKRGSLAWTQTEDGAAELSILAVRMPLLAFAGIIVAIILTLGATAVGFLITMDLSGIDVGRSLVILVGGSLGIVASIALIATMRASRRLWMIRIDADAVTATSGHSTWTQPLTDLRLVRLRQRTDYARIVFVGASTRLSLLAGLGIAADPNDTKNVYVTEFSSAAEGHLRKAGLTAHRSAQSPDLVDWLTSRRPD